MRGFGDTEASARYEPYSIEVDETDDVYEDWTLTEVNEWTSGDGWEIKKGSTCILLPKLRKDQPDPHVGDTVRVYGSLGRPVQGMVHNGEVIWYCWPEQQEAKRRRMLEDMKAQGERDEVRSRPERQRQYDSLFPCFQARIDRFRAENSEFATQAMGEAYELFVVEQATRLIEHFGSDGVALKVWADMNYEAQVDNPIPGFQTGVHSGNTFACAVQFARSYMEGNREF